MTDPHRGYPGPVVVPFLVSILLALLAVYAAFVLADTFGATLTFAGAVIAVTTLYVVVINP